MAGPTIFVDMRSQPCRAVIMFLRCSSISYETTIVDLLKGEHKKPDFSSLYPLMRVPAMKDGDLAIAESVAIFRYLTAKYPGQFPDHWYPADLGRRAKIDEYIAYHHQGMREPLTGLIIKEMFSPAPVPKERIDEQVKFCQESLDIFEKVFISKTPFINGEEISFADALAVNEILETIICGHDFTENRPKLKAYVDRFKSKVGPDLFDEIFEESNKWAEELKAAKN